MKIELDESRPVKAVDPETGKIVRKFASLMGADRHGFTRAHVRLACTGKKPTYKGWAWFYAD